MSGIRITSKTENGAEAIRRHIKDSKKESFKNRLLYRQAFREVVEEEPLRLSIIGKHRYLGPAAIEPIAVDMMDANGATPDDYEIEVIE